MIENNVKNFFSSYAVDFDSIYGYGKRRNLLLKFVDKYLRKSMFGRYIKTLEFIDNVKLNSVLDIGCGSGIYLETIGRKKIEIAGIDLSQNMIDMTEKRLSKAKLKAKKLIVGSYLDIQLEKKYDLSILMGFFDYVEEPLVTLRKVINDTNQYILASFPKKGGVLYFQRKIRYKFRNCPIFFYNYIDLEKIINELKIKEYQIIDNDREYYVIITK